MAPPKLSPIDGWPCWIGRLEWELDTGWEWDSTGLAVQPGEVRRKAGRLASLEKGFARPERQPHTTPSS